MATAYEDVLTAITAASAGAKVGTLCTGIKSSVRAAYIARADQDLRPQAVKALDTVLDEIAAASATTATALGL